jgi:hypothetical protein
MGGAILAYGLLGILGGSMAYYRLKRIPRPNWLRDTHYWVGIILILLVLLLLAIGIVGTIGHYGSLGHSSHLRAGLSVVVLVLLSGWSAHQIENLKWARILHLSLNLLLLIGLVWVSLTGWEVVQKYLP